MVPGGDRNAAAAPIYQTTEQRLDEIEMIGRGGPKA
jgi:hypothetical protein